MNIYDFFCLQDRYFNPKTPNTALKGIVTGSIPKEFFIFISNFLHSPFETPGKLQVLSEKKELERLKELERILAKEELDLEIQLLMIYTLEKLGKHNNPEIALFAAESINSVESRYNKKIYELKEKIEKDDEESVLDYYKKIIVLYYQYGYINRSKEDIQDFYFREALNYFNYLDKNEYINKDLLIIRIKLLNKLKRFNESRGILREFQDILPIELKTLLAVEIEYEDRDFDGIQEIIGQYTSCHLNSKTQEISKRLSIW